MAVSTRESAESTPGATAPGRDAPRPRRASLAAAFVAGILGAGALVALLFALGALDRADRTPSGPLSGAAIAERYEQAMAEVIEKAYPAAVGIDVTTAHGADRTGSGVVVDTDGLVLTADHVVERARMLVVTVAVDADDVPRGAIRASLPAAANERGITMIRVRGSVVARAPASDLAIVRIPAKPQAAIPLGDSGDLRLGHQVIAIGNTLALGGRATVTSGIVSGFRDLERSDGRRFPNLIQIDAAINQGNSGGPLIDSAGRLVGINTIAASAGAAEDVGFAIEADRARELIARARAGDAGR